MQCMYGNTHMPMVLCDVLLVIKQNIATKQMIGTLLNNNIT